MKDSNLKVDEAIIRYEPVRADGQSEPSAFNVVDTSTRIKATFAVDDVESVRDVPGTDLSKVTLVNGRVIYVEVTVTEMFDLLRAAGE